MEHNAVLRPLYALQAQGMGRFGFSVFNSEAEADMAIQAVKELAQSK